MKYRKIILPVLVIVVLLSAFTVKYGKYFEISKNIEIFTNVYKEINTWYVDDLDPSQLMKTGVDAMLESLDPYTVYYSESQIEGYRYMTEGKYDGVGARIKPIDNFPTIVEPFENSPAILAGLKAGDQVIAINGESAEGKTADEMGAVVRGVPGTEVRMTIRRPGEKGTKEVTLVRGEVHVTNVPYSGFVADGIGYIALTTFTQNAGRNVANALRDMKTENPDIKGLILDLRDNGGGLLREAVNVSNVFVPKGEEIASTKGKVVERDLSYKTKKEPVDIEIPLVILINKFSASASEIVSGVMQDLDRGVLIGQRSYGKGLVQNTRDGGYNSKVKMTTSKYYIPSGRCIQSVEYEDGEPKDIADNLRTPFKTRNGREVLDGGGVSPDILLEKEGQPEIVRDLLDKNMVFKYVTDYCIGKDSMPPMEKYEFTEFQGFLEFLDQSAFNYQTDAEKEIADLESKLDSDDPVNLQSEISMMRAKIEKDKSNHLEKYKDQIIDMIEMDIAGRYYFQKGKTTQRLKDDDELDRAIALLNAPAEYHSILK
jgi:carboxyl-terminal processing protease